MASFTLLMFFFAIVSTGWSPTSAEDSSGVVRERRHLLKKKLCIKYGVCNGGGFQGGYQGGYQGGNQGGYHGGQQPPINIAISQSQSSANGADGGYANGQYPNNYQYNGGYPHQGGYPNQGYGGYQGNYGGHQGGYGGYQGGYGPGHFGNGQGAYNNQFNGNYYGPSSLGGQNGGYGGYGFQRPFGPFYDENSSEEGNRPQHSHEEDDVSAGSYSGEHSPDQSSYNRGYEGPEGENFAAAGAFAVSGRKNH